MSIINKTLLQEAAAYLQKVAVVPAGGGMPADPSMMGGMPPGAAGGMPMDPSMMGGMPMDPSMMGGAPAPAPATMPPAPAPAPAPAAGGGSGGKTKINPDAIYALLWKIEKMFLIMANQLGVQFPPEVLQSAPPDPAAVAAAADQQASIDGAAASAAAPAPAPSGGGGAPAEPAPATPLGLPPMPMMGKAAAPLAEIIGIPIQQFAVTEKEAEAEDASAITDALEAVAYRATSITDLFKRARNAH